MICCCEDWLAASQAMPPGLARVVTVRTFKERPRLRRSRPQLGSVCAGRRAVTEPSWMPWSSWTESSPYFGPTDPRQIPPHPCLGRRLSRAAPTAQRFGCSAWVHESVLAESNWRLRGAAPLARRVLQHRF